MPIDCLYVNPRSVCLTFNHIVILYPHTSDSAILLLRAVLVCVQIPKRQLVWAQNNYHSFGNSCTYLKSDTWFAHNEYDFKGRTFRWRDTIHISYRLKEDSTWEKYDVVASMLHLFLLFLLRKYCIKYKYLCTVFNHTGKSTTAYYMQHFIVYFILQ